MWLTIVGAASKVVGLISGLIGDLYRWAAVYFAYKYGKYKERMKGALAVSKVRKMYLEIFSRPKLRRDALLERMRLRKRRD